MLLFFSPLILGRCNSHYLCKNTLFSNVTVCNLVCTYLNRKQRKPESRAFHDAFVQCYIVQYSAHVNETARISSNLCSIFYKDQNIPRLIYCCGETMLNGWRHYKDLYCSDIG